ncbi:MAG: site-2 protease family protein [Ignavibacteria bacterium]|nr:site-2 protease family protein [Ignavibacteria bacterium]
MEIANSIFYFIITIAILVLVHEFGHFIAAKLSGMRVDAFAIGFGQRLFGRNKKLGFSFGSLPKVKDENGNLSEIDLEGETDYRVCLLPLGGYVKIAGMIDESMDKSFLKREPQSWEFRSKSTGKKIFVLSAGVLMNFLLAFLIFWGINFVKGKQHFKTVQVGYVTKNSPAEKAGFKFGDKILSINGNKVEYWDEILNQIFVKKIGEDIQVIVDRDGKEVVLNIARNQIPDEKTSKPFLVPKEVMLYVGQVFDKTPAKEK